MKPANYIIQIMRPRLILLLFVLLVTINHASCIYAGDQATRVPPVVSSSWLKENISDPGLIILHVAATRLDYDNGHIAGAQFLWPGYVVISTENESIVPAPLKEVTRLLRSLGVNNDSHIILCGNYGNIIPVCRVFVNLEHYGLKSRVSILNGGLDEWKAAGFEVSKEIKPAKKGNFTASLYSNLVDVRFMTNSLTNKSYYIIDARPKPQYDGTVGTPRAGHIPGAKNLPQTEMYDPKTFLFAADEKIIQAFKKLEIPQGSQPLLYCHTGNSASIDYVASVIAGYDPILYDGSMEEWAGRLDLPIESTPNP
jgi:thiosulfate/3-mercaptopyruvate sulfurtransferase